MAAGGSAALLLLWAGSAAAHVHTDPSSVTSGTEATVGFGVEHGCDGSPTVAMRFKIPAEVTDAKGVAKTGWTVENGSGTVTFSGGSLGPDTADHFDISFTVPTGVTRLDFPVVQQCAEGQNDWISIAADGQPEPDSPAPRLTVVAPGEAAPASEHGDHDDGAAPGTTTAADGEHGDHDHADGEDHATSEQAAADGSATTTAAAADGATVTTVTVAADGDDGGTGNIVSVVVGLVGVAAVGTGAALMVKRRR
ncbi:MAG: YcnI family protein [Acidimicrobiia bacterium]